jgi:hypothetical protein
LRTLPTLVESLTTRDDYMLLADYQAYVVC